MAKRSGKPTPPFTQAFATWQVAAREARLSGLEYGVLLTLAQDPPDRRNRSVLSMSAERIAERMSTPTSAVKDNQVRHALSKLCAKEFTLWKLESDGTLVDSGARAPILTRLDAHAHAGRAQRYQLNIPAQWPEADHERGSKSGRKRKKRVESDALIERVESDAQVRVESDASSVSNPTRHVRKNPLFGVLRSTEKEGGSSLREGQEGRAGDTRVRVPDGTHAVPDAPAADEREGVDADEDAEGREDEG